MFCYKVHPINFVMWVRFKDDMKLEYNIKNVWNQFSVFWKWKGMCVQNWTVPKLLYSGTSSSCSDCEKVNIFEVNPGGGIRTDQWCKVKETHYKKEFSEIVVCTKACTVYPNPGRSVGYPCAWQQLAVSVSLTWGSFKILKDC